MRKPYVLGIDIGGTNTAFGIVDERGNILGRSSIKTQTHKVFEDYLNELHSAVMDLLEEYDAVDKIEGIGVGAPNANYYTGEIVSPANLPWDGIIPLTKLFSEKFGGIPVKVTNDANAAALGEMTYGAARGMKDFIMITLGTGVGSGIVANGRLIYGHDGFAGELGHVVVDRLNGRSCGCGRKGCLETYCSASGVARTARELLGNSVKPSVLREIPIDEITSKDVYDAAVAGDELANEIFETTGRILGEALSDFVSFSSPQAIVIFGGLAKSGDYLMKPLKKAFDENVLYVYKGKTDILLSSLNEGDAAILGASALGWETEA